jgi:hypothetical protein
MPQKSILWRRFFRAYKRSFKRYRVISEKIPSNQLKAHKLLSDYS